MVSLCRILALGAMAALCAACLEARAAAVDPDGEAIRWAVMRYEGEAGVEDIDELVAASVPHNGGVISQIEFVLEHSQGWQRTGFDFQRISNGSDADILVFIFPNDEAVSCGGHGLAAGCAGGAEYDGRVICQITAANDWRDTIVINHEIGHCLGLPHSDGPGVMTVDYSKLRSWPTDEEIEAARQNIE
ncbi:MAG TPA: matrixin family metalloprotease [Dehalococcoidia bacterium]|nr:matrixin family metalloprotease [Dehalococcoidia bacterium]